MNPEPNQPFSSADTEPSAVSAAAPIGLIILLSVLCYGGMLYVDRHGGEFSPLVYAPYRNMDSVLNAQPRSEGPNLRRGQELFSSLCVACHQASGLGLPGQFPPLAGSEWVNEPDPARLIRIPLLGLMGPIKVKDQEWNLSTVMTPLGSALQDDEDYAALLSYIRQAWGNKAPPVTAAQIKAVRAEIGNRTDYWTAEELLKISLNE